MSQADGHYPRLNAALVQSGKFNNMIASFVGSFVGDGFRCCDNGVIQISAEHAEIPPSEEGMIHEIIGHIVEPNLVEVFVTRELSKDLNLEIYNKMLAVQHSQKFAHYFAPVDGIPSN